MRTPNKITCTTTKLRTPLNAGWRRMLMSQTNQSRRRLSCSTDFSLRDVIFQQSHTIVLVIKFLRCLTKDWTVSTARHAWHTVWNKIRCRCGWGVSRRMREKIRTQNNLLVVLPSKREECKVNEDERRTFFSLSRELFIAVLNIIVIGITRLFLARSIARVPLTHQTIQLPYSQSKGALDTYTYTHTHTHHLKTMANTFLFSLFLLGNDNKPRSSH